MVYYNELTIRRLRLIFDGFKIIPPICQIMLNLEESAKVRNFAEIAPDNAMSFI